MLTYWSQDSMVLGKVVCPENAAFRKPDGVFKSINQKMHTGGTVCDLTDGTLKHGVP